MTTPRRLRRPAPKREHKALRVAALARQSGMSLDPWQVEALRRVFDRYGSLGQFQSEVLRAFTFTVPAPPTPLVLQERAGWWRAAGKHYFGTGTNA